MSSHAIHRVDNGNGKSLPATPSSREPTGRLSRLQEMVDRAERRKRHSSRSREMNSATNTDDNRTTRRSHSDRLSLRDATQQGSRVSSAKSSAWTMSPLASGKLLQSPLARPSSPHASRQHTAASRSGSYIETPLGSEISIRSGRQSSSSSVPLSGHPSIKDSITSNSSAPSSRSRPSIGRLHSEIGRNEAMYRTFEMLQEDMNRFQQRIWLGSQIGEAMLQYYDGSGATVLERLTQIVISAQEYDFEAIFARAQIWRALILHDTSATIHVPEIIFTVVSRRYANDPLTQADYYQLKKLLLFYTEEVEHIFQENVVRDDSAQENDGVVQERLVPRLLQYVDSKFDQKQWPDLEGLLNHSGSGANSVVAKAIAPRAEIELQTTREQNELLRKQNELLRLQREQLESDKIRYQEERKLFDPEGVLSTGYDYDGCFPQHSVDDSVDSAQSLFLSRLAPDDNQFKSQEIAHLGSNIRSERTTTASGDVQKQRTLPSSASKLSNVGLVGRWLVSASPATDQSPNRRPWGTPGSMPESWQRKQSTPLSWNLRTPSVSVSERYRLSSKDYDYPLMSGHAPPRALRVRNKDSATSRRWSSKGSWRQPASQRTSTSGTCSSFHGSLQVSPLRFGAIRKSQAVEKVEALGNQTETIAATSAAAALENDRYTPESASVAKATLEGLISGLKSSRSVSMEDVEPISPRTMPRSPESSVDLPKMNDEKETRNPSAIQIPGRRPSAPSPTSPVLTLDTADVPLTDTPALKKLAELAPHFREHQEQRRQSQSYLSSPTSPSSTSYEHERSRAIASLGDLRFIANPQRDTTIAKGISPRSPILGIVSTTASDTASHPESTPLSAEFTSQYSVPKPKTLYERRGRQDGRTGPSIKTSPSAAPLTPGKKSPPSSAISKPETEKGSMIIGASKHILSPKAFTYIPYSRHRDPETAVPLLDELESMDISSQDESPSSSSGRNQQVMHEHWPSEDNSTSTDLQGYSPDSVRISKMLAKLQTEQSYIRRPSQPIVSSPLRRSSRISDEEDEDAQPSTCATGGTGPGIRLPDHELGQLIASRTSSATRPTSGEVGAEEALQKVDGPAEVSVIHVQQNATLTQAGPDQHVGNTSSTKRSSTSSTDTRPWGIIPASRRRRISEHDQPTTENNASIYDHIGDEYPSPVSPQKPG